MQCYQVNEYFQPFFKHSSICGTSVTENKCINYIFELTVYVNQNVLLHAKKCVEKW